jgi:hypothetical protein
MFGIEKELQKGLEMLGKKIAPAITKGIENGAKILGDIIAAKMDELNERNKAD